MALLTVWRRPRHPRPQRARRPFHAASQSPILTRRPRAEGTAWDEAGKEYLGPLPDRRAQCRPSPSAPDAPPSPINSRLTHMACQVGMYDVYVDLATRLNALSEAARKTLLVTTGRSTENVGQDRASAYEAERCRFHRRGHGGPCWRCR
jgi:hypothetical protein